MNVRKKGKGRITREINGEKEDRKGERDYGEAKTGRGMGREKKRRGGGKG